MSLIRGRFWSRIHVLIRFAGLTGLLVAAVGLVMALIVMEVFELDQLLERGWEASARVAVGAALWEDLPLLFLIGGLIAGLFTLVVEAVMVVNFVAGRRSAFGFNALVQVALAATLLVGLNWYAFWHYARFDWTRDQQFTLPDELQQQLGQLRGETTIIVYQRHRTFGQFGDKPDAYDFAAERKVVEKVKDLVDQFREFGSQFRVEVLDIEEDRYKEKLDQVTELLASKWLRAEQQRTAPDRVGQPFRDEDRQRLRHKAEQLRRDIEAAPENSIFFVADGHDRLQRLSFNEFYHLDKAASRHANGGNGNLVLLYQGVEPFARKVLNIDEKKPRIGILVVHELLTSEGPEEFGLGGLKKALSQRGFEVRDIVLKRWSDFGPPEPAVYTYEESKFDRLEEQLLQLDADLQALQTELSEFEKVKKLWETATLAELSKQYADQLNGKPVTEFLRRRQLDFLEQNILFRQVILKQYQEERNSVAAEKARLNVDTTAEQRRMTDLKAKLERAIADCDLLIVPRMTLINVNIDWAIAPRLHRLDDAQVAAIRDFLKAGKPVLACLGPTNERRERFSPEPTEEGPDGLERALTDLGFHLGKHTVLFNVESKSFAERRSGLLASGVNVEVPPVDFQGKASSGGSLAAAAERAEQAPNPIQQSMQIIARSVAAPESEARLDLRLRHPRPIYFDRDRAKKLFFQPEFMFTDPASWNDDNPFPSRERTPRFEPPKPDDPSRGTFDEKRRGPFPIGVAVETTVPASWYEETGAKPASARVAVVGHGGVFVGQELSPAREMLLLNTCNWLLGRDELLPSDERVWQYPRLESVPLSDEPMTRAARNLWIFAAYLVPFVFLYLGLVVWMVRQLR